MTTKLQQYFPILRERKEILAEIEGVGKLKREFHAWTKEQQEEFLDFCTGVRGVKFLYDSFFKEIMDPAMVPERIERFLSAVFGEQVKILQTLPLESPRLAGETTLLVMDIIVQLADGRIVNLEVQKIGYKFPGERCACYSADLLLRQYMRVREEKKKNTFSYKDIKGVYTIVLFEHSPRELQEFQDIYKHHAEQKFDTGLKMNLLQEYEFIALDIYQKIYHNKINNKKEPVFENELEAWLAFLSMDDPEVVMQLAEQYPDFRAMYEEVYQRCRNVEGVMQMFSKELAELDRNTVQLMIDEMRDEVKELEKEKNKLIAEKESLLEEKEKVMAEKERATAEKDRVTAEKDRVTAEKDKEIAEKESKLQSMLQTLYAEVKDIQKVSRMTGCSVEEVEAAVGKQ